MNISEMFEQAGQVAVLQFDCRESYDGHLDLRQANAVKKYQPDIIFLEYPMHGETPDISLNQYQPKEKPDKLIQERMSVFSEELLKKHPWAESDKVMWQHIIELWNSSKQALVYEVDAPADLTDDPVREAWANLYPCAMKNWLWWVPIYLREKIMAKNIRWALKEYKQKSDPTILVFLQSFHWEHIRFLLRDPRKDEVWDYYFGQFEHIPQFKNISPEYIAGRIQKVSDTFYKYWKKEADF